MQGPKDLECACECVGRKLAEATLDHHYSPYPAKKSSEELQAYKLVLIGRLKIPDGNEDKIKQYYDMFMGLYIKGIEMR